MKGVRAGRMVVCSISVFVEIHGGSLGGVMALRNVEKRFNVNFPCDTGN
jgi:hypothetical protein